MTGSAGGEDVRRAFWTVLPVLKGFRALAYRDYRLLWFGTLVSNLGDWMDSTAVSWYVLALTNSAWYLGLVQVCRSLPILIFTLFGGVAADRLDRRKLVMSTQILAMLLAFALAGVIVFQVGNIWMVLAISTLRGIALSFNLPTRNALIGDLVPQRDLGAAIGLHFTTVNISKVLGPALGGVLIAIWGVPICMLLNAISFLPVIWALHIMGFRENQRPKATESPWQALVTGVEFMVRAPSIRGIMFLALLPIVLGQPYQVLLPIFARDILQVGAVGFGMLSGAVGIGAVLGALWVSARPDEPNRMGVMIWACAVFGLGVTLFAFSGWYILSILLLMVVGGAYTIYRSQNNTLLQLLAPDELRGRVVSAAYLSRGLLPLGAAIAGFAASVWGAPMTMGVMGASLLALTPLARLWTGGQRVVAPAAVLGENLESRG